MLRHLKAGVAALILAAAMSAGGLAQMPATNFQPVALTEANASAALGAVPDFVAVAQNYQGAGGDLDALAGLSTSAAAQADLNNAAAANGFAGYGDWVAVMQTIMSTYAYIQSAGAIQQMGPAMDAAMQQVLANPNIPQAQKDQIIAQMGAVAGTQADAPSAENQAIVSALTPQIQSMMQQLQLLQ